MKLRSTLLILLMAFSMIVFNHSNVSASTRTEVINVVKNKDILEETLNPNTDETYHPLDRKFQRMSSIVQVGSRIYAAWTAGGNTEPHVDNYIVVAYSDDKGHTWVDPYLVIDPLDYQNGDKAQLPSFWINPDGVLFLFYSCNKSGYKYIVSNNADASDINDVVWSNPIKSNSGGGYNRPVTLSNGVALLTTQGGDKLTNPVYASYDKGISWQKLSETTSSAGNAKVYNESSIVELSDGTLMYLARLENPTSTGGMERAYSYDGGNSWTSSEYNLPYPLRSAGSRFYFGKLSNGNLALVTNDSKDTTRKNLTIFISEDDGETWPYSLLLDDRYPVSYPDLYEGEDGTLAIVYDAGGNVGNNVYGLCEIRMAYITLEDVKAGRLINKNSYIKGVISKSDRGVEVKEVTTQFENKIRVIKGTPRSDVISSLPTSITIIDENENTYTFEGRWISEDFNGNEEGRYTFYFESDEWDIKELQDNYSLLKVKVDVYKEKSPDYTIYLLIGGGVLGILVIGIVSYLFLKGRTKHV